MKKLALALFLLPAITISAAAEKPNPADFTVKVHVISSESRCAGIATSNGMCGGGLQVLEAIVDGKQVQFRGTSFGILAIADYTARISKEIHGPKNANTYDIYLGYDFLMPDGSTRSYTVTRLGPAIPTNP